jgi:hypothetical protein
MPLFGMEKQAGKLEVIPIQPNWASALWKLVLVAN